jgi:hypothetical protein
MKAADSGGSSGGVLWQRRTLISREPKRAISLTGTSKVEIRAVILSSPCSTAVSARAAPAGRPARTNTSPQAAGRALRRTRALNFEHRLIFRDSAKGFSSEDIGISGLAHKF